MNVHHALLYFLDHDDEVRAVLSDLDTSYAVTTYKYNAWGIDHSRTLITEAYRTEGAGKTRCFAVVTSSLTSEAQNALLKVFEEPPGQSKFVLIIPRGTFLLPTLRSRMQTAAITSSRTNHDIGTSFELWRALPLSAQIEEIDTRLKKKDALWTQSIVQEATAFLRQSVALFSAIERESLWFALQQVQQRGASNKMLLEHIALLISRVR